MTETMTSATRERVGWSRSEVAERAARDIQPGSYVNLGIGLPMQIAGALPADADVWLHTENGILGLGPLAFGDDIDRDITNAGKEYSTIVSGAASFDSALSFAIVRGGHLDVAVLGAMEIAGNGDLANWTAPGRTAGVGGAMDLVVGAKQLWVLTDHVTKKGSAKLMQECTLPLTGRGCVDRIYSNLGIFEPDGSGFRCVEVAPGVSPQSIRQVTDAPVSFVEADVVSVGADS